MSRVLSKYVMTMDGGMNQVAAKMKTKKTTSVVLIDFRHEQNFDALLALLILLVLFLFLLLLLLSDEDM